MIASTFDHETKTITVIPAGGPRGVATMLVALGNAGIEVERLVRRDHRLGEVLMRINGNGELAARVLNAVGCQVVGAPEQHAVDTAA